jgi:hypothetical protein
MRRQERDRARSSNRWLASLAQAIQCPEDRLPDELGSTGAEIVCRFINLLDEHRRQPEEDRVIIFQFGSHAVSLSRYTHFASAALPDMLFRLYPGSLLHFFGDLLLDHEVVFGFPDRTQIHFSFRFSSQSFKIIGHVYFSRQSDDCG